MYIKNLAVEQIRSMGLEEEPEQVPVRGRSDIGQPGVRLEECEEVRARLDGLMQGGIKRS